MLNLCLHCGANRVERSQIADSNTPESTNTWVPIAHHRLLNQVERSLEGCGLIIESQAHALWGDDARYFGLLEVFNDQSVNDYGLVIGLRNSHDKTFPAGIAVGAGVFVCDNLSFSGEITIARKHTRFIERDLPQLVNRAIGHLGELRLQQDERIAAYRQQRITDKTAHDLMIRAVDAQILPITQVPRLVQEWREPGHEEFTEDGKSVWRWMNACTEALKGRNLAQLPKRTQAMHGLLDSICGIAV
ncbi:hypothetical protein [Rubinisphaera sp.]|uniref:hypothetical protein n=1 Tax=Rubinisphaera sp. TaxID=2024857 RepID=UPI000C0E6135|nr:hypothetical protein [Rubinisphaera sp.]MBV08203.1 DUF932 domain-containing protein [Rubinisphaera sp.]HCS54672.1 DUF932 domain-containing protein [Planctomycetaceae bacterium]|tara:strand:- start:2851 stop:3588 length:738 start_codon:yes stop_codon:yes gene_type:complete